MLPVANPAEGSLYIIPEIRSLLHLRHLKVALCLPTVAWRDDSLGHEGLEDHT